MAGFFSGSGRKRTEGYPETVRQADGGGMISSHAGWGASPDE
uniref:Uncharacterized protein n=1 Tax=Faecalibaculum rodentium TaxID=1702221 RepID=A0A140DWN5_9FIRM|nr:hypothetical protein AALO17_19280 [Faecalibaculum rodentium]